jgi:hypothetical protein
MLPFWLARAGFGFLCGAVLALLEYLHYFPLMSPPSELGLDSFRALLVGYGGNGFLLALIVAAAERRARPRELRAWELAAAVVAGAVLGVLLWQGFTHFVLRDHLGLRLFTEHVGQPRMWAGALLYQSWLMLVFGGLAAAVYASRRWRARMLEALRSAEIARAKSESVLAQARLDSLQARVDPELVFRNLAQLEALYVTDLAAAERSLDELVSSLRGGTYMTDRIRRTA